MSDQRPAELDATPGGLGEALVRLAEASTPPVVPAPPPSAVHSVRDGVVALVVAAVVCLALDAEGLVAWAQRLEVSEAQSAALAVLRPVHEATTGVGLASLRRGLARSGDDVAGLFGAREDPVLAEGWAPPEPRAAVVALPPAPPAPATTPDAGLPAPGPALAVVEAVEAPTGPPGVLLLGDSMIAGSLGATLRAALERGGRWRVAHAYQLGTGLARPDVYDWMKVLPPLLERERPRFVVVSLGGNDGTNIREGDEVVEFGTPRWRQLYGARVEAMMQALAAEDSRVIWLGLPPMRDARLARRAAWLNAVFAQAARRVPRVEFLQLDMLVSPGDGQYATFLQGPDGRLVRYRLDDGVHLAPAASRAIARWVLDWLRERSR